MKNKTVPTTRKRVWLGVSVPVNSPPQMVAGGNR